MGQPWFILTKRFGTDIRNPSSETLRDAVDEVINPAHRDDVEHSSAFVRYGLDEGPMYVLTYDTSRHLTFEQWADQDFETELAPVGYLSEVAPAEARRLMALLGCGSVDEVKAQAWMPHR